MKAILSFKNEEYELRVDENKTIHIEGDCFRNLGLYIADSITGEIEGDYIEFSYYANENILRDGSAKIYYSELPEMGTTANIDLINYFGKEIYNIFTNGYPTKLNEIEVIEHHLIGSMEELIECGYISKYDIEDENKEKVKELIEENLESSLDDTFFIDNLRKDVGKIELSIFDN